MEIDAPPKAFLSVVEEVSLHSFVRFAYAKFFARISHWDR